MFFLFVVGAVGAALAGKVGVGASVQQLRKALQVFSSTNEVGTLVEAVQGLYQHQAEFTSNGSGDKKPGSRINREDLKLICYEYIYT